MERTDIQLGVRALTIAAILIGALSWAVPTHATSFTVTTTTDSNDGACTPTLCSLRDAIDAANATGGAVLVTVPAGIYRLPLGALVLTPSAGAPTLTLTLAGAGQGITILDGAHQHRVFDIDLGDTAKISDVTIQHGEGEPSTTPAGAGHTHGACVHNHGTIVLTNVTITHCEAANPTNQNGGGGLWNAVTGIATLTNVTITHNTTTASGGGLGNVGTLVGTAVTINHNAADLFGGGLIDSKNGTVTLDHSTISSNSATNGGDEIYTDSTTGAVTLKGSTGPTAVGHGQG